jgi:[NiFe] hydrogenase diaphorase moiety small subunit
MTGTESTILVDEVPVPFKPRQTILEAASDAGIFIPHLCHHPELGAHGSCRVCTVIVNGCKASACTMKAASGQEIEVDTPDLHAYRRTLIRRCLWRATTSAPAARKAETASCRRSATTAK